MIKLKLSPEQAESMEVALDMAMSNCDNDEEYGYFAELLELVKQAQERAYA